MIELRNVTILKAGTHLFRNLNFTIKRGEHWVVQGPNGSGKTTLLRLIAGSLHPVEGEVYHNFIEPGDWDNLYHQRLEKIHFIPTHWLQEFLSGYQSLFYQQRYYSMDESMLPTVREVFGEAIRALNTLRISPSFDITSLLDLPVTRLSNGQLKKVIILRQLVKNIPKVLIMDYPFDGLDAESRSDLNEFIDAIVQHFNVQIVLTAHMDRLPRVINRRLLINKFKIERIESFTQPASAAHPHVLSHGVNTGAEPVVEMKNVTIAYNQRKIISNLNWRIHKGERWALTGKNGSGKTTLFSLIYADHPMAYSEKVFLFGKRRGSGESIWDIKKRISYFGPEQIHFLEAGLKRFSGRDYIGLQGHQKMDQLDNLIDFFEGHNYIDLPMNTLSSGQLQLVLLMNLLLDDRELLLLDEPFQFLDPENHGRVTRYLHQFLDENTTLVMITHDERDVAEWTHLRMQL